MNATDAPAIEHAPELALRRRRLRRRAGAAAAATVGLAAAAIAVANPFEGASGSSGDTLDNGSATSLATLERRSVSSQIQVNATLGYADASTIVAPAGTTPSEVRQAQQTVVADRGQLETARGTLAADRQALEQVRAQIAADRQTAAVECGGVNAAEASGGSSSSDGGGGNSSACSTAAQAVATDEQNLDSAAAKVAADTLSVAAAETALAGAEQSLAAARSSAALYGQTSAYTYLPEVGQVIRRGGTLFAIDDRPVVLLYGRVTAWRAFRAGMSPGRDVAELNANLRALGYGSGLSGNAFTSATAAAIRSFQAARGVAPSGELLLGAVVFEPRAVRVTSVTPSRGAVVQTGAVLEVTSTRRQVEIALDAGQQADVKVGDPVTITLPDNRTTTRGRVSYVGTVATEPSDSGDSQNSSQSPTIEVHVTPTDPAATGRLDQAPVTVAITTATVDRALVVPVNALLALAGGGYAVERVAADGTHRLVPVEPGLFDDADGLVQVTGPGLAPGQRIVVPAQ
jgi:peptidoglycan hydrolase-like protein with peptidoglycan-binding domain